MVQTCPFPHLRREALLEDSLLGDHSFATLQIDLVLKSFASDTIIDYLTNTSLGSYYPQATLSYHTLCKVPPLVLDPLVTFSYQESGDMVTAR